SHRRAYRAARPYSRRRSGPGFARRRTQPDHDLDRAAQRGEHRRRPAHDRRRRHQAAAARGQGDRRRLSGQGAGQRARGQGRLLQRAEGGGIIMPNSSDHALTTLTLAAARDGLKAKTFSATELTQAHVKAMERTRALNAYITETPELALKQAAASDAKLAK